MWGKGWGGITYLPEKGGGGEGGLHTPGLKISEPSIPGKKKTTLVLTLGSLPVKGEKKKKKGHVRFSIEVLKP